METQLQVLWDDGERVVCRWRRPGDKDGQSVLLVRPAAEHPLPSSLDRLTREFEIKYMLGGAWSVRPLEVIRDQGRTMLVLEDPGGEPLACLLQGPVEIERFLRLAIRIAEALAQVHRHGLVHKDLKPSNIWVDCADGRARLAGFGLASRLPRERQSPDALETIAGTLAYMAPEQTGRMNRSVDTRSDLYAFGVVLYEMLTGALPFAATDAMEWVHCHIARVPLAPAERDETLPVAVSDIVIKLLAKTAEERYQTALGVERDLRRCLADWQRYRRVDAFTPGLDDTADRLLIPEKLYGRRHDVAVLVAACERVVKSREPELVVVSGYSGIGKSSIVNELHKALVPSRGLFASGKFDQYKRDVPYATLVQAMRSLVRPIFAKSETELKRWQDAIRDALDVNARLMTDLVPELKLLIGEPPPVPALEPQQAQRRFMLVFRRFIGVFARAEHPLVLFVDDLQWLDAATLDLLEDLLISSDLHHLIVVGAYRDNEVDANHALTGKLQAIRDAGVPIKEIKLAPLDATQVKRLLAEALRCDDALAEPLSRLVHSKTAGNPYFVNQFVHALVDEQLLSFDYDAKCWRCDTDGIHAKGYTDNVVDLMVDKLGRLPAESLQALQQLACLGNAAEVASLSKVLDVSEAQVHGRLREAVKKELVERRQQVYRFSHDRVHEAAYSLLPETERVAAHLRIGRQLAADTPLKGREEAIFEIVGQLNRSAMLITSREEREQLAEFNLLAGLRAKASTAYASALTYFAFGVEYLSEESWERRHDMMFALELNRAACEFLTGRLSSADERLTSLSMRAATSVEQASIACLHTDVCTTLDQSDRAVAVCLDYLRHVDIDWPAHPNEALVQYEYERIALLLADAPIEALIDLPMMDDAASLATAEVLTKLFAPALQTDANLVALMSCKAVNLSLEHGNCDASCFAYVMLSRVAGPRFGDYRLGFRFGQLGYELVKQRGLRRFEANTYLCFALFSVRWMEHIRGTRALLRRAFESANRTGDLMYAAFACTNLYSDLLFMGESLPGIQEEAERGLAFTKKVGFGLVIEFIATQLAFMRMLRGLTREFGHLDDEQFDERSAELQLSSNPALAVPACYYWIRKLQARYMAGDYAAALAAASNAQALLWTSSLFIEEGEYHFYSALAHAAWHDVDLSAVRAHHRQLQIWAVNCPENFADRVALVGAELARIEGRILEAERLYDEAIRHAQQNGFVHNEAIASELASRFYAAHKLDKIARVYLQDARYAYSRWRADGKVRQLDERYPFLRGSSPAPGPTATIATPVEHLDLGTVIKVSLAASSDIVLENLIDMVMRTAIEQAGAQRGVLILSGDNGHRVVAQAATSGDATEMRLRDMPVSAVPMPEKILNHALRTREIVILDDAASEPTFADDAYVQQRRARSVLCMPLTNQKKLIGALYLENNILPGVFNPARVAVLKLLVSQAAISLENARLYQDLAERESKIRRLVDANIIGIIVWNADGVVLEANDAFLRMVGYERDDVVSGNVRWTDLTPVEWRHLSERALTETMQSGRARPYEKEYLKKDGGRVPVIVGLATFEESRMEGVAFVLDLTERKRAEEDARRSERRVREVQAELAHANRVDTMGQLAASIVHEVKQPISATIINSDVAKRWLNAQPPNLDEVRLVLERIHADGNRAVDVISRIRDLIKKTSPQRGQVDMNAAIREVIELTQFEAGKNSVSIETRLADPLPFVESDRVELQQVLLNLIINAIEAMRGMSDGVRTVLVSTTVSDQGWIVATVSDSGPGFDSASVERVFAPFFTTKPTGLGMGLSICRSIIEAHGGRLWASANTPRGAVVQFTVPAVVGASQ